MDARAARAPLPDRVEVAVVGAGFTGLAAACALARRGARVAVLEAGRVGEGASGRSGGIVLEDTAAGPLDGVEGCIPTLQKHLAETGIDCDLHLGGCFELAHRPPESAAPGPLRWRDGESALVVEERVPGGTLDPGALLSGLLRAALEAGATVHERTPVRSLELGGDALLELGDRALACDAAVLGLNGYTAELVPDL
ncbi:MAG: FAD-dependent oxidoreductase, partial [Myxococcota bacterium]